MPNLYFALTDDTAIEIAVLPALFSVTIDGESFGYVADDPFHLYLVIAVEEGGFPDPKRFPEHIPRRYRYFVLDDGIPPKFVQPIQRPKWYILHQPPPLQIADVDWTTGKVSPKPKHPHPSDYGVRLIDEIDQETVELSFEIVKRYSL